MFSQEFCEIFQNTHLYLIIDVYMQKSVLKNPTKFTAKFMSTAAPGISQNKPLLGQLQIY